MDRLMSDLWRNAPLGSAAARGVFPALNVWEADEGLWVEAELPGVREEDLEIAVLGDQLTIRGERKSNMTEGAAQHRRERGVGTFRRVVQLPVAVDADRIEASLSAGVLTIHLPKAEAAKPRKIEVNTK
jgi:HSP20 family protein